MQLSAKYHKPTIVARLNKEGYIKGSARGVNESDLESFKNFLSSTNLFEYTAGHDQAFGISIKDKDLSKLHNIANKELENIDFGQSAYSVSFVCNANDKNIEDIVFDLSIYNEVWGQMNPQPLMAVESLFINKKDIQVIGKNKDTLKITKNYITYIKFHAKELIGRLPEYDKIKLTVVGKPSVNSWGGLQTAQIIIEDLDMENAELSF